MAIEYKPGGIEESIGARRDTAQNIKLTKVVSASLSEKPGSALAIDYNYLPPPREGYNRFFTISEEERVQDLVMRSRNYILTFTYRPAQLNGKPYRMYAEGGIEGNMEIKLGEAYQIPNNIDGINKKLIIRKEKLKS